MKDQYDQEIPTNLVVLSEHKPSDFSEEELEIIRNARWYNVGGWIFIPFQDVYGVGAEWDSFLDLLDLSSIERISGSLYRWSDEDGFYHA